MTDTNVHELPPPSRTVEQIRADIDQQKRAAAQRRLEPLVQRARARAAELRDNPPTREQVRYAMRMWRGVVT